MKLKIIFAIQLLLISLIAKSQNLPKDSIYGNVKKIREKVIFLTEIENPQLLYYDDYGHSGFMGPEMAISRFYNTWYESNSCYYLNYERHFDTKRRITKDVWFGKKDNFINSYKYSYDEKDRLKSAVDSSEYSVSTVNHYFYDYEDGYFNENIIYENSKSNSFSHHLIKYEKGKKIRTKSYDEAGNIDEYIFQYNENGKPISRIHKNPNTWKNYDDKSRSYGAHDSIGITYKDVAYEYDAKNRLIKKQYFTLDEYSNKPVPGGKFKYIYQNDNLIREIKGNEKDDGKYQVNYKYDKYGRLTEKYCCDEDISKSREIAKYTYEGDKVSDLNYSTEFYELNKLEHYKISFSYKYDNNKNWIEIIKTVNGIKLYKWIREIEYY